MAKDFAYYFAQLRRIEEHRAKGAEKEIRRIYKTILKDTQHWLADEYMELAEDGELTYAMLQGKGQYARFLDEVESRLSGITPQVSAEIRKTVEDVYRLAYQGMADAVSKAKSNDELTTLLEGVRNVDAATIKAAVENPVAGLTLNDTLERNRKEIIYDIKRQIGIGLTQGDRQTTMAKRITKSLDGNYKKAVCVARTEVHRVREAGHNDSCNQINGELGNAGVEERLVKIWRCMKDERTRSSHIAMEGQEVPVEEKFTLPGGAKTDSPGNSGIASEDINCRCFVEYALKKKERAPFEHVPYSSAPTPTDTLSVDQYQKAKKELEENAQMNFSDEEVRRMMDSVYEYTSGDYLDVLAATADFKGIYAQYSISMSAQAKETASKKAEALATYLKNAPKYKGAAYRGLGFDFGGDYDDGSWASFRKKITEGNVITMDGVSSWTSKKSVMDDVIEARTGLDESAEGVARVKLILEDAKSGVDISEYAQLKGQKEVLFPKETAYKISKVEKKTRYDDYDDLEIVDLVIHLTEV